MNTKLKQLKNQVDEEKYIFNDVVDLKKYSFSPDGWENMLFANKKAIECKYIHIELNQSSQEITFDHELNKINKLKTIKKILDYGNDKIKLIFINRINHLIKLYCQSDDNTELSLDSLRLMIFFIITFNEQLINPQISIDDNGLFQIMLKKQDDSIINIIFDFNQHVNFVILSNNIEIDSKNILNGNFYIKKFINLINKLNLFSL